MSSYMPNYNEKEQMRAAKRAVKIAASTARAALSVLAVAARDVTGVAWEAFSRRYRLQRRHKLWGVVIDRVKRERKDKRRIHAFKRTPWTAEKEHAAIEMLLANHRHRLVDRIDELDSLRGFHEAVKMLAGGKS